MTRRRAFDWLLIVVLTGLWAGFFARGIADGLHTQRGVLWIGVSSAPASDAYPTVSWWRQKPLEQGSQLETLDGEDLRGSTALHFYDRAIRAARERGFVSARASRAGTSFETRLELFPSKLWWVPFPGSAASLLIAILILIRAPGWHLARLNLVSTWCFAASPVLFNRFVGGPGATSFEAILSALLLTIGAGLLVWIAQEFTLSARPVPRLHRVFALLAGTLFAVEFAVALLAPYDVGLDDWRVFAIVAYLAVATIAGLMRAYLRSSSLERRQVRWVMLGLSVAVVGALFATVASLDPGGPIGWIVPRDPRGAIGGVVQAVTLLGAPVGILVSVIGYRWLDVDRLISAAASYTIVGLVVLGGAAAVIPRLAQAAAPIVGVGAEITEWLLTIALVVAAIPAHRLLRPWIDRRMFAERHQRTLGFERLLDEIGGYASVEELVRLAAERIDALLEPTSIAVYTRDGSSFVPLFVRGRATPPAIDNDSLLVRALERRGRPFSADAEELDAFDRATLETLGVKLVVPTLGPDGVVAFACLGSKRSGDIYTPEEIAQLGAVADRCSAVLLRLVEERGAPGIGVPLPQVFRRDGEFWTIASAGKEIRLRDMRGLHYLATLLREPGREFHATDLVGSGGTGVFAPAARDPSLAVVGGLGDAGAAIDGRARAAYRERLRALDEHQAEAERNSDLGSLGVLAAEREALLAELEGAARGRRAVSHSERARVAVTKAIKAALEKIVERHPELGAHLSATIRRGYACAYVPDPRVPVEWEI